jgi:hypothetical protein
MSRIDWRRLRLMCLWWQRGRKRESGLMMLVILNRDVNDVKNEEASMRCATAPVF